MSSNVSHCSTVQVNGRVISEIKYDANGMKFTGQMMRLTDMIVVFKRLVVSLFVYGSISYCRSAMLQIIRMRVYSALSFYKFKRHNMTIQQKNGLCICIAMFLLASFLTFNIFKCAYARLYVEGTYVESSTPWNTLMANGIMA